MRWAMLAWTALFLGVMALSMFERSHPVSEDRVSSCPTCEVGY